MTQSRPRDADSEDRPSVPLDLVAIGLLTVATVAVVLAVGPGTLPAMVLGVPFLLFAPGYAFIAAVFPERGSNDRTGARQGLLNWGRSPGGPSAGTVTDQLGEHGVDGIERFVLSVGLSLAIVPLSGMALNRLGYLISPAYVVQLTGAMTILLVAVGAVRRLRLSPEKRFRVPVRRPLAFDARSRFDTRRDILLNVLLAGSLLFALGGIGYAVGTSGSADTDFALLAENETGELVADGFPTELERGTPSQIHVSIANREQRTVDYTVVVALQRTSRADDRIEVTEFHELETRSVRVTANETRIEPYQITPTATGPRLRLVFLLYRGTAPENPTTENAYRRAQLWVDVS